MGFPFRVAKNILKTVLSENDGITTDNHVIFLTEFSIQIQNDRPVILAFLN